MKTTQSTDKIKSSSRHLKNIFYSHALISVADGVRNRFRMHIPISIYFRMFRNRFRIHIPISIYFRMFRINVLYKKYL